MDASLWARRRRRQIGGTAVAGALRRLPRQRVVDTLDALASVTAQVLVLAQRDDPIHPLDSAEALAEALPRADLRRQRHPLGVGARAPSSRDGVGLPVGVRCATPFPVDCRYGDTHGRRTPRLDIVVGSPMGHDHGRTERLDLADATLREWDATVLDVDDDGIVLDRSAFYPGGGGSRPTTASCSGAGVQTRIVGARQGRRHSLVRSTATRATRRHRRAGRCRGRPPHQR